MQKELSRSEELQRDFEAVERASDAVNRAVFVGRVASKVSSCMEILNSLKEVIISEMKKESENEKTES